MASGRSRSPPRGEGSDKLLRATATASHAGLQAVSSGFTVSRPVTWPRLCVPKGNYAGVYMGRIAGIRADGRFDLHNITRRWVNFKLLQRADGYAYA